MRQEPQVHSPQHLVGVAVMLIAVAVMLTCAGIMFLMEAF